jgi:hypothetical protein
MVSASGLSRFSQQGGEHEEQHNPMAELAALPVQAGKRKLWYRENALEATRPIVLCDPENGWNEIITES